MRASNLIRFWAGSFAVAAVSCLTIATAHAQLSLTGALDFTSDATGSFGNGFYNSLAGDGAFDLAVIAGNPDLGGAVNSGFNARNGAFLNNPVTGRINIDLTVPGTYTFTILGGTGVSGPYNGLNLFFNGNDTTPRISALAQEQTSLASVPGFTANLNANSRNLQVNTVVPAAGTVVFSANGLTASLVDFRFGGPNLYSPAVDRLGSAINNTGGGSDAVGQFTLRVTSNAAAAPEPGALALLAGGMLPCIGLVIRRSRVRAS
jgi:hypothetical protein